MIKNLMTGFLEAREKRKGKYTKSSLKKYTVLHCTVLNFGSIMSYMLFLFSYAWLESFPKLQMIV